MSKKIQTNVSVISKRNVCEIACKAYNRAFSTDNLQSAFRQTGIYPIDKSIILNDSLTLSAVFTSNDTDTSEETFDQADQDMPLLAELPAEKETTVSQREVDCKKVKLVVRKKPRKTTEKIVLEKLITKKKVVGKVHE